MHAAESRADFRQHIHGREADVRVLDHLRVLAAQFYAARRERPRLKCLIAHRHRLARVKPALLRRKSARKTALGIGVHLGAGDLILFGQILRRVAHGAAAGGIEQRLPQKILELDAPHGEAAPVRVGGDGIAAHRFRADDQRQRRAPERQSVRGLHQSLDPCAADALHEMGGNLLRHAGIEPDVARQHVGVKTRLGHIARDDHFDIARAHTAFGEGGARRLDAEVDRRDERQRAVVIGEGRAHAVDEISVGELRAQAGLFLAHDAVLRIAARASITAAGRGAA